MQNDTRVILYPNYINSLKTMAKGRRIPKDKACEHPHPLEMLDCCVKGLSLEAEVERKAYSRDFWVLGRIRVKLKKDDGSPANPKIPNRKALMLAVAELVPKHPNRHGKGPRIGQAPQPPQAPAAEGATSSAPSSTVTAKGKAPGAKDKKGKKKR